MVSVVFVQIDRQVARISPELWLNLSWDDHKMSEKCVFAIYPFSREK